MSDFPDGNYALKFAKEDYEAKAIPISLKGGTLRKNDVELFMNRPTQEQTMDFISTHFKSSSKANAFGIVTTRYWNVQLLNQWPDENLKGHYYIRVSFDYEDNWYKFSCVQAL